MKSVKRNVEEDEKVQRKMERERWSKMKSGKRKVEENGKLYEQGVGR